MKYSLMLLPSIPIPVVLHKERERKRALASRGNNLATITPDSIEAEASDRINTKNCN
jgi:hypothetical protein